MANCKFLGVLFQDKSTFEQQKVKKKVHIDEVVKTFQM